MNVTHTLIVSQGLRITGPDHPEGTRSGKCWYLFLETQSKLTQALWGDNPQREVIEWDNDREMILDQALRLSEQYQVALIQQ